MKSASRLRMKAASRPFSSSTTLAWTLPLLSGIITIRQLWPWSSETRKAVGSPESPSAESVQSQLAKIQRPLERTWMGLRQKVPSSGKRVE